MRGKIGLAVMLLAVAVLVLAESSSYGGHRRRGNCGSCGTACASGSCETAAEASPSDATAPAAPPAPAKGAAVSPPVEAPQVAKSEASGPSNQTYYSTRRARRASRR
jgi:hypothetical protein